MQHMEEGTLEEGILDEAFLAELDRLEAVGRMQDLDFAGVVVRIATDRFCALKSSSRLDIDRFVSIMDRALERAAPEEVARVSGRIASRGDLPERLLWRLTLSGPQAATIADQHATNPHAAAAITVFVNDAGRDAMMSASPMRFPVGSAIVKKKVDPRAGNDVALLYTVMVKHEEGYNPAVGDWEFIVVDPDGRTVQARGALANCIACHQPQRSKDFVFRTYLEQ